MKTLHTQKNARFASAFVATIAFLSGHQRALGQPQPEPPPIAPVQLPPSQPPPGQPPPGQPPPSQPPPSQPPGGGWIPGPQAPPGQWQEPAGPGPVIVMPPGYLEQPGQWPRRLPVEEQGDPPPLGYHVSKEPRRALWIAGTSIFSAAYAITGLVAGGMLAEEGEAEDALLYIPILGPIIWAPIRSPLDTEDGRGLFTGMSLVTAAQGVGFALMIAGFVFKQPAFYRNDVDAKVEAPAVKPTFGFGPGGIQAGLSF